MRERDEVVGTMGGARLGGWWGVAGSSCPRLRRGALGMRERDEVIGTMGGAWLGGGGVSPALPA
jgi:uncharacterized membrane protein